MWCRALWPRKEASMATTITNDYLIIECYTEILDNKGVQRIYWMPNGYALSAVNNPKLHGYDFAWEFAVLKNGHIVYDTPLTSEVVITMSDDDANKFIHHAYEVLSTWTPSQALQVSASQVSPFDSSADSPIFESERSGSENLESEPSSLA